jgi:hypothetical protein
MPWQHTLAAVSMKLLSFLPISCVRVPLFGWTSMAEDSAFIKLVASPAQRSTRQAQWQQ